VYIIFLPGGAQCYDQASCNSRSIQLSSSSQWPSSITVDGILSDKLFVSSKAYLGYCSSDGYMGNVGASPATWGLHFRGQALINAMIKRLRTSHGLEEADLIIFAGVSAGARGVMTNIDSLIDDKILPSTQVVGYIDSPYYLDVVPFDPNFVGFPYAEQHKYQSMNTSGILSSLCKNNFSMSDYWKCQLGQYRMPFLKAPYFIVASRYDTYQLSNNLGLPLNSDGSASQLYNTAQINWANNFANITLLKLDNLIQRSKFGNLNSNVSRAFFLSACFNHGVSGSSQFYGSMKINNDNLLDAFSSFLNSIKSNATTSWVDSCNGFACGSYC